MSSTSRTNEVNTAYEVSTANTQVSTANLSDDTVYAFLASQPNGSQLVHEDLKQIYEDDLEEIDLKWQLALLSMRTRKFFQKTGRKITINGSDTTRYDKSKVECFNCHKLGHFARECKGPRNQDNRSKNQDSSRRTINVEEISSKSMLAIDGAEEFQQPEFEGYGSKTSKSVSEDTSKEVGESTDASLVEELVSNDKLKKKTIFPTVAKINFVRPQQQEKPVRKPANCNYHQKERMISGNNYTRMNYNYSDKKAHPSVHRNIVPRAVLMKTGLRPLNTARPVNNAHPKTIVFSARPMSCFSKSAHSTIKRPYSIKTTLTNKNYSQKVNTAKGSFYIARPKAINTARPNSAVVNAIRENQVNAVKALSCWVWRPTKLNSASITFKRHNCVNARGISKSTSRNLMKDMLPLGEEPNEEELLVKELLKLMCDKKNSVLFTDTGCFVLSPDFKLADESQVLLKVPRKNNMYSVDMKNIVPKESLTCLVAKATLDESMLWHRRLGHVNFKTINKLVKDNLVKGLPIKRFENDQTCVACLKGKQHKASCKSKIQNSITQPLFMLHMDLFGPTFMSSLMNKKYCLVVTDDYSRFTWVFFLASKDETSGILKSFITQIKNLVDKKVKIIKCDNGTEFKNRVMSEFCAKKGIKRKFSIARTPQQNGVAERRNRTLIEATRTMLADSKLPTTFWAEVVNIACYVQNRVLVVKPHNKTPYELFKGRTPSLSFMKPFRCHVTILNTLDHLDKFDGKSDDGFFVGYSLNSKAFRLYNIRTRKVEENLHVRFLEDKLIIADGSLFDSSSKDASNDEPQPSNDAEKKDDEGAIDDQERTKNNAQDINIVGLSINAASTNFNTGSLNINIVSPTVPTAPLESN
ncbi:putative ribonuclease H-like domain-containing protein [Tanacetum coccineum]|uniref:Ribonuclease H-like domain-containing protein n=1 Tax=Tanacetum coccineum TaxID=301880 RepID=A0ABQ5IPQ1_9ASTR